MAFRDLFDNDRRSKDDLRQEIEIRDRQIAALKTAEVKAKESAEQLRIDSEKLEKLLLESQATNRELKEEIRQHHEKLGQLEGAHRSEVLALREYQETRLSDLIDSKSIVVAQLQRNVKKLEEENAGHVANLSQYQKSLSSLLAELEQAQARGSEFESGNAMIAALRSYGISDVQQLQKRLSKENLPYVRFKNERAVDSLKTLHDENNQLRNDLLLCNSKLNRAIDENASEGPILRKLLEEVTKNSGQRIEELEADLKETKERNGNLFITNRAIDNENSELKKNSVTRTYHERKLDELKSSLNHEKARADRLFASVQVLESNRGANAEDSAILRRQITALTEEFEAHEEELEREIKELEDDLEVKRNTEKRIEAEIKDLESRYFKVQTNLTNPTVLRWLLENSSFQDASITGGIYAMTGDLPWESSALTDALAKRGFVKRRLPDDNVNFIILGKQGWSEKELIDKIKRSDRTLLQFYSQEMFVAKLVTNRDPFDTGDQELFEAFAKGHSGLEFLLGFLNDYWDQPWPYPAEDNDQGSWDGNWSDFGVSESPLHLAGYQVGATSKLSVYDRRQILRSCYLNELKFARDSTADYQKQWGKSGTPKRLFRIAQHLKQLADGQGRDHRKSEAQKDWINDLEWLRKEIYIKSGSKFKWP